ncbi:indole-3-glycerol phosphate synthase TrpC [Acidobacteria bacterium AH-259-O06]|nr:indole-3-glycerol phosphate synthase TrpC [Acidobacteria bacterium AH-259-O06]
MLAEIVAFKKRELMDTKRQLPLDDLLRQVPDLSPPSFNAAITQAGINIIAEIKYKSPSHGSFACQLPPGDLAKVYSESGAVALSVLTEKNYFAGDLQFLEEIHKELPELPLLRKDFIVDRYQIAEARIKGASAYLLIVSCLSGEELCSLISYGRDFQLDALVEVHDPFELERAMRNNARIIGVNNRNLRTFEVDIDTSFDVAKRMEGEENYILVSESGINEHAQIAELQDAGFSAFLIGSTLMDSPDPGKKLRQLKGEE